MKTHTLQHLLAMSFLWLATQPLPAATVSWINTNSGSWGTPANWSSGAVPGAADDVLITNGGTYTVTVNVNATVASLRVGGSSGTQTLVIPSSTLILNGASLLDTNCKFAFSGGTLAGSGDVTVTGTLTWTGGTMSGSGRTILASGSTLNMSGTGNKNLNRVLQNDGTGTWTGGTLVMNGGTFNNNGSLTVSSAATISIAGNGGGVNAFNNAGTFTKQGDGETVFFSRMPFNNSGAVDVQGGTLTFNAGFSQIAGSTTLSGGNVTSSSTLQIQGGMLGGVGTVMANVVSSGLVSPGASPGLLTITGNYTQTTNGALNIELAGLSAGATYDRLAVSGTASLAGALNVTLTNDFHPLLSANFTFLTAVTRTGAFATFNYPTNDVELLVNYTATEASVLVINVHPVLANQMHDELVLFQLNAADTGADSPLRTRAYALTNAPLGAIIDSVTGIISWTPTEAQGPMTTNLTVLVTDNGTPNLTVLRTFQSTVNEINVAPVLILPPSQSISEESAFSAMATATDSDLPTNTWSFELISGPSGLAVAPGGAISWTPTEAQGPGSYPVAVRVTDTNADAVNEQRLSTTNTITLTVQEVNRPPALSVPTNQVVTEQTLLSVAARATDPDDPANALTFTLISPPEGMVIDANTGVIFWTPNETQGPGTNVIRVVVTDHSPLAVNAKFLSATNSFTVVVDEVNSPPTVDAIADRTVNAGQTVAFTATATDADLPANALSFSLLSPPAGATISSGGAFSWRPEVTQADTTNQIQVVVKDGGLPPLRGTNTFWVVVNPNQSSNETEPHPADSNGDFKIAIGEVTAYGAAWKRGDAWPVAPNPIPIGYLTRAGALWKGGEIYQVDSNIPDAPLWWVNVPKGIGLQALSNNSSTAERTVSGLIVTLEIRPAASTGVYAIEESLPTGFTANAITGNGAFDANSSKIKWGPFFDNQPRLVGYTLVPPAGFNGLVALNGIASFDGQDVAFKGDLQIQVGEPGTGASDSSPVQRQVVANGNIVTVKLDVNPVASTFAQAIQESVPAGFTVSGLNEGGVFDVNSSKIKWGPYFDNSARKLDYVLTAPTDFTGVVSFSGVGSFDGVDYEISGDSEIVMGATGSPGLEGNIVVRTVQVQGQIAKILLRATTPPDTTAYAIEETVPSGFAVSDVNESGIFDANSSKVKWGPFFDATTRTLTYTLQAPAGFEGSVSISGTASFDGVDLVIAGDLSIPFEQGAATGTPRKPSIVQQPFDQIVPEGVPLALKVVVQSQQEGVRIQWQKDTTDIAGSVGQSATLFLGDARPEHAGEYRVLVHYDGGTLISDVATVIIQEADKDKENLSFYPLLTVRGAKADFRSTIGADSYDSHEVNARIPGDVIPIPSFGIGNIRLVGITPRKDFNSIGQLVLEQAH
ncbi:MAG: putative Ig domain-containing protein [Verrucomicrobia bacterium]|nr:putative Ig domain-containing protein [Verrucomicrobiota bacterium]